MIQVAVASAAADGDDNDVTKFNIKGAGLPAAVDAA